MMALKLFIREYISFFVFQLVLIAFMLIIFGLDGFRNIDTAIYMVSISLVLLISFLVVRYLLRQKYLVQITQTPVKMEDALQKNAKTPEHDVTVQYLHALYKVYQYEVQALHARQDRHEKFMNQWVHQMKTPLAVLDLLLQEETELDKHSVQEEVDRLKRGLEMVLVNARIDKFEEDMQIEQVSLKAIVTKVINENKRLFIANRVFPDIQINEDMKVTSDIKWLQFIISQFVTNAVKYTFEPNKKVYLSAVEIDEGITLVIRDEGIGIPKSDLSRVTKPFFTGENGRKTGESTGMGLYLAKEICEKLGHELTIQSEVNEGTTVTVKFQK